MSFTRAGPTIAPKKAHAMPAPLFHDSSKAQKIAVLLVAQKALHALGQYVGFKPTQPAYNHRQAHLEVGGREEAALLTHNFQYGAPAFAPLHRNLLALEKILEARDANVAEHEQCIVQLLQALAALGSTFFSLQLVSALRECPATAFAERISEWNSAREKSDNRANAEHGPHRGNVGDRRSAACSTGGRGNHPPTPQQRCPHPGSRDTKQPRHILREPREMVEKLLHKNTWEKYHGRSPQHLVHTYLGPVVVCNNTRG